VYIICSGELELNLPHSNSQAERVTILRIALAEKGVVDDSHYDAPRTPSTETVQQPTDTAVQVLARDSLAEPEDDGGIHL
jgi:hypothetical protein